MSVDELNFGPDQVRRAVVQQLEGLRRAGVTHWNRVAASISAATVVPPVASHTSTQRSKDVAILPTASEKLAMSGVPDRASSEKILVKNESLVTAEVSEVQKKNSPAKASVPHPADGFQPLNLPLAERVAGLAALAERVKACTRCQELASTRTQTVFGVGNPEAKIVFVGEAPGAEEDAQGEPFVGKSGQLLNDIIKACRIRREDIYICNVLRCRPPGNRLPEPGEAANCREYLDGQIAHVNPDYIVCWGACAAQNLLGTTDSIGKLRRRFLSYGRSKVLCTYHPSYLLRNPAAKKDVWEDMKMLFLDMGIDLSAKA